MAHLTVDPIPTTPGDSYFEGPALDWLFHEAESLRTVLAESGMVDEDIQRRVCEHYIFGLAARLDGAEVRDPMPPKAALGFELPERAIMSNGSFSFHEFAIAVVAEAFGEG